MSHIQYITSIHSTTPLQSLSMTNKNTNTVATARNSISIIIPCVSYHTHLLSNLLNILKYQTLKPKEVIISLSSIRKLTEERLTKIRALESRAFPFVLKILYHEEDVWAAGNKNRAASVATGDILVVQDADDIPHIQRLEVIKYFFDNYDIMHLCHGYQMRYLPGMIKHEAYKLLSFNWQVNKRKIPFMFCTEENRRSIRITNGEIAVKREVWLNYRWNEKRRIGEDTNYNRFIERLYNKTIYLNCCLMIYNKTQ